MKTRYGSSKQSNEIKTTTTKKKHVELNIKIPVLDKSPLELKVEKIKGDIIGFRTSNEQLLINNHMIESYKTAMLIDSDKFVKETAFQPSDVLDKIPSRRPVAKINRKSRVNSPIEVLTPKGTALPRVARFGALSIFSNDATAMPIVDPFLKNKLVDKDEFYAGESFESIVEAEHHEKDRESVVTHKQLEKRRDEDCKSAFKRACSQNKVMAKEGVPERKASATDYVYSTHLFENDIRWEWLHLIAHMLMGEPSQNSDNLVAGTAFANTEMMFAEATLNYLARVYPEGFKVSVKATLIPETHIAVAIQYSIVTADFILPLEFNTQTRNKPHIDYQGYFDYVVQQLVLNAKMFESINSTTKTDEIMTYSKKDIAKKNIVTGEVNTTQATKDTNALKDRPNRKVVIDTETTGLYVKDGHRVVELGAVEIIDGKITGKEYRQIINPQRSIPKMLHYKGIHHITDEVVKDKPTFKEVADKFCEFIKNAELIGHNLPFDLSMIENELKLANRSETLVGRYATDTLAEGRKKVPMNKNTELASHKLDDLCEYYRIDTSSREGGHSALVDSRLAAQLYLRLSDPNIKLFKPKVAVASVDETADAQEVKQKTRKR